MKQDKTRGTSGGNGNPSIDAEEVLRRTVQGFGQMVGAAMSQDRTRQSQELAQGAAIDDAQAPQEDPPQEGPDFFLVPSPERCRRVTEDEVPVAGIGTHSTGLEKAPATSPYRYRRRLMQSSALDGSPYGTPGPLVSSRVRRMISELYGARVSSPLDADYRPLSAKRRTLSLLFSGDSYGAPRSLGDIIPPLHLGRSPIFPRTTVLNNNQEVENDNGTGE